MLQIRLFKSLIGEKPINVKTVNALGIRKVGQSTLKVDTPQIRGMVHQIKHLVTVEEVADEPKTTKTAKKSTKKES